MVGQKARSLLAEFQGANHVITSSRMEMNDTWTSPMAPNYKVNVDDANFSHIHESGVRLVICDHEGSVAVAMNNKLLQPLGPLEIEAKTMEIGVSFAWDTSIRDVIVESDSKIVADTLLGFCTLPMVVSNVLTSIAYKFQDFRSVQVSHVKHHDNKPTYLLAKFSIEINN